MPSQLPLTNLTPVLPWSFKNAMSCSVPRLPPQSKITWLSRRWRSLTSENKSISRKQNPGLLSPFCSQEGNQWGRHCYSSVFSLADKFHVVGRACVTAATEAAAGPGFQSHSCRWLSPTAPLWLQQAAWETVFIFRCQGLGSSGGRSSLPSGLQQTQWGNRRLIRKDEPECFATLSFCFGSIV